MRARIVVSSWDGIGVPAIARLSEAERSRIIALVKTTPPGRPVAGPWPEGLTAAGEDQAAVQTLDTLTGAARASDTPSRRPGADAVPRRTAPVTVPHP